MSTGLRFRRISRLAVLIAFSLLSASLVQAGDWPTWRGPDRSDVSLETNLLDSWPAGGPQQVWVSRDAGLGYSGFSVVGDQLFTMGADDTTEYIIAISTKTGSKLWQLAVGERLKNGWGDGPRGTPTWADGLVVAIGGKGDVVCCSAADGTEVWRASLTAMGGSIPNWGYTESPLVDQGRVIVTPGGSQGTMVALDLKSGRPLWQSSDLTDQAHYSSVIVAEHYGQRQYIQLTKDTVFGVGAETGTVLWSHPWPGRTAVIPTPIYHDGYVYVTSGYGVGCMLIEVTKQNETKETYSNKKMKNHHGGAIRVGNHVYGHSDGVGWICQDFMTGDLVWYEKSKLKKGAVACADGKLYCIDENTGECVLIAASPDGWTESGRFTLSPQTEQRADRGRIWTHPVIANGRLYLRDQEIIIAYDISAQ